MTINEYDFVVIGAGMSGLSVARVLSKNKKNVLVIEKMPQVGGRVQTVEFKGAVIDTGAQFFMESYSRIPDLIDELKLRDEKVMASPITGVTRYRKLHKVNQKNPLSLWSSGLLSSFEFFKFMYETLRKIKFLKLIPMEELCALKDFDNQTAQDWCLQTMGKGNLDAVVNPFFSSFTYCSSEHSSQVLAMRMLGHLKLKGKIFGLKKGLNSLPQKISEELEIKLGESVKEIVKEEGSMRIITDKSEYFCKKVILATPSPIAYKLFPNPKVIENDLLEIKYHSTFHIGMVFKKKNFVNKYKIMNDVYGLIIAEQDNRYVNVLGVERNKNQYCALNETELINAIFTAQAYREFKDKDDNFLVDLAMKEVSIRTPYCKEDLIDYHVTRWKNAIPSYPVGHTKRVDQYRKQIKKEDRILLTGDYLGTPCADGAIEAGDFLGKKILELEN